MIRLVLLTALVSSTLNAAPPTKIFEGSQNLFGSKLLFASEAKEKLSAIENFVKENSAHYQASFDPDCFYKQTGNKQCGKEQPSEEYQKLIKELSEETNGAFKVEVETADGKKRDFGGIAQGAVLEELARKFETGWYGNFSGDIYVAPETKLDEPLFIADSEMPTVPFAKLKMDHGWVSGSSSPANGGTVHDKKIKNFEFDRIVLFAKPEFNGARLDAWSTALVTGGKDLLRHLRSLKKYKGQWTYVYFQNDGEVVCATDIKCELTDIKNRTVSVDWTKKMGI